MSAPATEEDKALIERISASGKTAIALLNKTDISTSDMYSFDGSAFDKVIRISALEGVGFDELASTVDSMFIDGTIDIGNDAIVTGARQYAALINAEQALVQSVLDLKDLLPFDLASVGIESALSALGEVDGREIGEEIVAEIFSKFCVGK